MSGLGFLLNYKNMSEGILVPGLGGRRSLIAQRGYVAVLNFFRPASSHIHFFYPRWETSETRDEKYGRLRQLTDKVKPRKVFAVSAGGTLAVPLSVEFPDISTTHLICAKVTGAEKIGPDRQKQAPAFKPAAAISESMVDNGAVDSDRFACYVPKNDKDGVIESVDMLVPGALVVDLPPLKHAFAIGYALARYLPVR
jgi:hypothetical protein